MNAPVRFIVAAFVVSSLFAAVPSSVRANHTDTCQSPTNYRAFVGRTHNPTGSVTGPRQI